MSDIDKTLESVTRVCKAREMDLEASIAKLASGSTYEALRHIHELWRDHVCMMFCQCDRVVFESGLTKDCQDIVQEVLGTMDAEFERATGRRYVNETCRNMAITKQLREQGR